MDIKEIENLGYELHRNSKDWEGKTHKYCTCHKNMGSINYFDSLYDLETWVYQVKQIRATQNGNDELADRLNLILVSRKTNTPLPELLRQLGRV